jgi:Zinc knuckle
MNPEQPLPPPAGKGSKQGTCFKCQEKGHYADACPNDGKNGESGAANLLIAGVKEREFDEFTEWSEQW